MENQTLPVAGNGSTEPNPSADSAKMDNDQKIQPAASPAVRFASVDEEIAPTSQLDLNTNSSTEPPAKEDPKVNQLTKALQGSDLQGRRMSCYAFEPVSLPASRVPSHDDSSREASRNNTHVSTGRQSPPHHSPLVPSMHSPPITPAATRSRDADDPKTKDATEQVKAEEDSTESTVQTTSQPGASPSSTNVDDSRPGSSGDVSTRPTSHSQESAGVPPRQHAFSIGAMSSTSVPASRETSPGRAATLSSSRINKIPLPGGDAHDPYAAHKRPPQTKNLDAIDPRFKFSALGSKQRTSAVSLPRSSTSKSTLSTSDKRSSGIFGHKEKADSFLSPGNDESNSGLNSKHGSVADLKRFFKLGHKSKRTISSTTASSGTRTPPLVSKSPQLPFEDAHGLTTKYGKFGKLLGAGAGGSVRIVKRADGVTFAVKEFRAKHSYESEKEYAKKVTAEFCIGSTLHHGNIIETLDIVHEKGRWYEVMEFAPYDLFACVMTGKMSREEVSCSFLQILSGVTFLHAQGLAHRDLKLDNVVVNEHGIMKIIDFGSASIFKYPFENGLVLASGIVGSDPYLAPEVYDERKYDPQPTDIWSLAIIFCCMSLRRFPWKLPRMTDNSYKLFASAPSPGTDIRRISAVSSPTSPDAEASKPEGDHAGEKGGEKKDVPLDTKETEAVGPAEKKEEKDTSPKKQEVIKGPWRLLRLLPRETRHIIGRMLEIDPRKRAKMEEIHADDWVANTAICSQSDTTVTLAPGHTHTLEPPAPPATTTGKK